MITSEVMKKALALSIVIPVYNEESYIEACLDAVASQTVAPFEVIVVDNNSSDETVALAHKYPFVTLLHEPEQGVLYARQTGMNAAIGDVIGRIDGDTILDSDWVERVVDSFTDKSVSIVTGPAGYYDLVLPRTVRWGQHKLLQVARLLGYSFLFGCNMAIRRSVWQSVAPKVCFNSEIFEDLDVAAHLWDADIKSVYNPHMKVMLSARRLESNPRDFWQYIRGHTRTARHHGHSLLGAYYAEVCFMMAYLAVKPLHMCFHPVTRRPSLTWLLQRPAARPNPMNVTLGE